MSEKKSNEAEVDNPKGPSKIPPTDQERKRSVSVQDLLDMRQNIEKLETEQKQTNALVVGLVQGIESKVIPMLDEHQSILVSLPKQLEESFMKQTEQMKGYIERRLNPVDQAKAPAPGAAPDVTKKSGLDVKSVLDWADKQIQASGGIKNLLSGNSASSATISLDSEFKDILTQVQRQTILDVKNLYRQRFGLGPLSEETASGPVVVKAP